ncbi:aldehyde dehydrogenase 7B4 [Prunus dulcis]|uniref:Aldehyde dehydrogenase 7B4 n=1 Tax=Prunus dulcis TaxID=3755 RepID=A0A4Y1RWS4_PRUDU|nr:aldehyde dehydrogenase 7B4 [Prunus dulcis]
MGFAKKEYEFLSEIGLGPENPGGFINGNWKASGPVISTVNPSNNQQIAKVTEVSIEDYEEGLRACNEAAKTWKSLPAPKRGEIVRQIGDALREKLQHLGRLVSLEMGKILAEGIGEVQEVIDMCDYAVGLSRQLNGSIVPSERWNACIALVCVMSEHKTGCTNNSIGTIAVTKLVAEYLHESIYQSVLDQLVGLYKQVKIGDPLEKGTLVGPVHTQASRENFEKGISTIKSQAWGKILTGGSVIESDGNFVQPTIVEISSDASVVKEELFGPVLYVMKIKTLEEAIELNNSVPQGLSSSVFTSKPETIFKWIGPHGSDCGIVNVNIPTNGAEIGGAFGGEKATGGGREAGSDSWKQYMRRSTCTINYGSELPLAQGINFG